MWSPSLGPDDDRGREHAAAEVLEPGGAVVPVPIFLVVAAPVVVVEGPVAGEPLVGRHDVEVTVGVEVGRPDGERRRRDVGLDLQHRAANAPPPMFSITLTTPRPSTP